MKPWEGDDPTEPPPVGTVVVAGVLLGGRVRGSPRMVCLVTATGVYPGGSLTEGKPYPWAHGRWQRRDGSWSKPTRVLQRPWVPYQLELPVDQEEHRLHRWER